METRAKNCWGLNSQLKTCMQEREQFHARKMRSIARAVHEEEERRKKEREERMASGRIPKR
jgi:hypothetical protein